jgi:hypothetical protein
MSNRHKARRLAGALPVIAAAAVIAGAAGAADLKLEPKKQAESGILQLLQALFQPQPQAAATPAQRAATPPQRQTAQTTQAPPRKTAHKTARTLTSPPLVTGSISWPKSARATLSPATAAISYAHAAKAAFARARAAMDLGVMLLDDAPKNNTEALATATVNVLSELEALKRLPQNQTNEAVKRAVDLVEDWHRTGLKIINPPPQGLEKVPFPLTVTAKAEAIAEALDQLISQADAFATAKLSARPSITAPGSVPAH